MPSSYLKIKQIACQLLGLAACTCGLGTYVWQEVAGESKRDFERAHISYHDIVLKYPRAVAWLFYQAVLAKSLGRRRCTASSWGDAMFSVAYFCLNEA